MKSVLLDTGPLVALLDRADPAHAFTRDGIEKVTARVFTTGAVVTEAMFHLQDLRGGPERLLDFLTHAQSEIADLFDARSLERAVALMTTYQDTPMDFADASLVVLAERFDCPDILTLDERGFRTFRFAGRRRFHLVLQD